MSALTGCFFIEKAWTPSCQVWDCPNAACTVTTILDMDDVRACFATQEDLPPLLEDCAATWTGTTCFVDQTLQSATEPATCNGLLEEDAVLCCTTSGNAFELTAQGTADQNALNSLLEGLEQTCGLELVNQTDPYGCDYVGDPYILEACPEKEKLSPPGNLAEFELTIDPEQSWVAVDLGTESEFSSLEGVAYAATSPKRFLRGLAWAEDFAHDDDDFTHNHVVLSASIELSANGTTFTVPVNQDFVLAFQGLREGLEYAASFEPTTASGGTLDPSAGEWHYDYNQTASGTSIAVHLEGPVVVLSWP